MDLESLLKSILNNSTKVISKENFSDWELDWSYPAFQAHRGFHLNYEEENSWISLSRAKEHGFLIAEVDVQLTKDRVPILFHDFNLEKSKGIDINIMNLNFAELKQFGDFPKLQDVLQSSDRPDLLNIEIKSKNFISFESEHLILTLIESLKMSRNVVISSFNPWSLLYAKVNFPKIHRALIATDKKESWNVFYLRKMLTIPLIKPHALHIQNEMFEPLETDLQTVLNPIAVWTVNDRSRSEFLLERGVSSIITDRLGP